ncbi:hypothetical protein ACIG87_04940 [Micromonospora sp. NPDC051925]|uniref:hypothetical protein n=1 Tax=Micromonospora sp. NPDC051925 TaxID=3364288 RepID=UPI0037C8CB9B
MNQGSDASLAGFVRDTHLLAALVAWAKGFGGTVRVLSHPRRMRGYTEAFSFTIMMDQPDSQGRLRSHKLLVKVLPSQPAADEADRHARARTASPTFAADHLVEQHFGCHQVGDGRYLTFQDVANAGDPVRELSELNGADLVRTTRNLVAALLDTWNGGGSPTRSGLPINPSTVGEYVRRELKVAASLPEVHAAARRLRLTLDRDCLNVDGKSLPNPLRLADDDSTLGRIKIDYAYGFSHGDLHGGNVLVAATADGIDPHRFLLVDLDNYEHEAPLTRDLVWFLLTTVLRWVAPHPKEDESRRDPLPRDQADALLRRLVTPESLADDPVLPTLSELIGIIHEGGVTYATKGNWKPEWRAQYRLSLVSQALACATFDNLGDAGRLWCFRLAAYAAQAFHRELASKGVPPPPETVPTLPRPAPEPAGTGVSSWDGVWPITPAIVSEYPHTPALDEAATPGRRGRHRAPVAARSNGLPSLGFRRSAADEVREPGAAAGDNQPTRGRRSPAPNSSARLSPPRQRTNLGQFSLSVPGGPAWKGLLKRIAIAALGGSLVSVGLPGATAERVPNEWKVTPLPSHGLQPDTPSPDVSAARRKLHQLAATAAEQSEPVMDGRYAYIFLRVWSPDDLEPHSDDLDRYKEERLWWTVQRSGRRIVVDVSGNRSTEPVITMYDAGELTDVPPNPPEDLARLRAYFDELLNDKPPELQNAAGILQLVGLLHQFRPLTPGQRSALLNLLAETPGITLQGRSSDWAHRSGFSISADDGQGRREILTIEESTGRLLSHETIGRADAVLSYYLFLTAARTETMADDR